MLYTEDKKAGNSYRKKYLLSIEKIISERQTKARARLDGMRKDIVLNPEKKREELKKLLGWPIDEQVPEGFKACEEFVAEDELCNIYRVTMELEIGLTTYGILMLPKGVTKPKAAIVQHGGAGCPELLIGLYRQTNYNDMPRRLLRRGMAVYAPQLLLWNADDLECESFDRNAIDAKLKQLGSSITALEVFNLQRVVDYLKKRKDIDSSELAMVGLSYGGFYTLFISALDLRIKRAYSSCFFNDRMIYSWADWTWFNSAFTCLDAQVASLIAPRRLYIEVADNDEVFSSDGAIPLADFVSDIYSRLGCQSEFSFNVFSGCHEFSKIDDGIDFILKNI